MSSSSDISRYFSAKKLILPILIGMGVALYFFLKDFDVNAYQSIHWSFPTFFWLIAAACMIVTRLIGYAYRLIVLSNRNLNWKQASQIVILWEFSSAVTPGIVGGTAAALILLAKEKNINSGKGTAIVLATSYLDVLFYVLVIPLLALFVHQSDVIPHSIGAISSETIVNYFITAYMVFVAWCIIIFIGLFYKPEAIKDSVKFIFRLPYLRRFKDKVDAWGESLLVAAQEFSLEPKSYWCKAFGGTVLAWISRFLLVNFLILALGHGGAVLEILAKQLVMWGALMVPITPGAVGVAEGLFSGFMDVYFVNEQLTNTTAFIWRLLSYWPYLFAGLIVFPMWFGRVRNTPKVK